MTARRVTVTTGIPGREHDGTYSVRMTVYGLPSIEAAQKARRIFRSAFQFRAQEIADADEGNNANGPADG